VSGERIIGDLSGLPATGFRSHSMWTWAGAGFMLIEGTGFVLAIATYFYIMAGADQWPLTDGAPRLVWGTLNTLLAAASLIPNFFVSRAARRRNLAATRFWIIVMAAVGAAALVLRAMEFTALNTRWDQDAYGSVVWALIVMHTVHFLTDFADTFFLAVFLHTHPPCDERFADTDDNAGYWAFIVAWQVVIYVILYWAPRWAP
jgi:heme/copper-type cytochrome/quinol oxidase subunit 3